MNRKEVDSFRMIACTEPAEVLGTVGFHGLPTVC